tara:strand:- start:977 stop:1096 length:120 start_codon:yes stop_codon:yes gene_type:complete
MKELKNKINERNNDDLIFLNKLIVRAFLKDGINLVIQII